MHSIESNDFCSLFISSFLIPVLSVKYILKKNCLLNIPNANCSDFSFLPHFLSTTMLIGCAKEYSLPALPLPPYS